MKKTLKISFKLRERIKNRIEKKKNNNKKLKIQITNKAIIVLNKADKKNFHLEKITIF